jgi:hypothetical protein
MNDDKIIRRAARRKVIANLPLILDQLLELMQDKAVASNARVQAINTLTKMAGMHENTADNDKEPYEMTADEIQQAIQDLKKQAENGGDSSIFQ